MNIKNYPDFKKNNEEKVNEVRTQKKCQMPDFEAVITSDTYNDMMAMGFVEVTKDTHGEVIVTKRATGGIRGFKDSLGNIGFYHPELAKGNRKPGYPYYNIKFDNVPKNSPDSGLSFLIIKVNTGPSKSHPYPKQNIEHKDKSCINAEDYLQLMGFLIKVLIKKQGFPITERELSDTESYKDVIRRKMTEDPSVVKKIEIPPSLKKEELGKGASALKEFGAFGD